MYDLVYDIVFEFVGMFTSLLANVGVPLDEYVGSFEFVLLSLLLFVFILGLILLPIKLFMFLVEVIFNV